MDQNMMTALLKTYGAAPTPRNMQQAQQFFASNPDQLERRAMGMRGSDGNNDNTDLLGPMLDKLMADSGAAPAASTAMANTQESNPVVAATTRGTIVPASTPKAKSATDAEMNAQLPKPNADVAPPSMHGPEGNWMDKFITALLGASSAKGVSMMAPGSDVVAPAAKTKALPRMIGEGGVPLLPDERAGQKLLTGPQKLLTGPDVVDEASSVVKNDPALEKQGREAQMRAEVDAENADLSAMQKAQQEKLSKQRATDDLVKSAKKAVGRK